MVHGELLQLSWHERILLTYDLPALIKNQTAISGDGWGIAFDGHTLVMTNGTDKLIHLNAHSYEILRIVTIFDSSSGRSIWGANELEWVDGEVWANLWLTDCIVRIDAHSGNVKGYVLLVGLVLRNRLARNTIAGYTCRLCTHAIFRAKYVKRTTKGRTSP